MSTELPVLAEQYEERRAQLLSDALDDAKKWCVPPEQRVSGKCSDQFWLRLFSSTTEKLTVDHVHRFLVGFQLTICVQWDKDRVASLIQEFRAQNFSDVRIAIAELARALTDCIRSRNKGRQTSAASKIAFFAKPQKEVFIWDKYASRSARFRQWSRTGEGAKLIGSLYKLRNGEHDYESYRDSCAATLDEERSNRDFLQSVEEFRAYLNRIGGPIGDGTIMHGSSFVERRFLDKLMFWEGSWLKTAMKKKQGEAI
jgi:hypothetical protein